MLAGGLTDGSICLWNPAKVLRSPAGNADEGAGAAVATLRKHTGPVKGLEFNASSPNLLASGSTDGDLVIWDVAQPSSPASYQLVCRKCQRALARRSLSRLEPPQSRAPYCRL